jgi:hypothetical protein
MFSRPQSSAGLARSSCCAGPDGESRAITEATTPAPAEAAAPTAAAVTPPLVLKRAPIGDNQDDYDVLENGVIVGRIFAVPVAPQDRPWKWASGHIGREAAMAAFAKSWRRNCG